MVPLHAIVTAGANLHPAAGLGNGPALRTSNCRRSRPPIDASAKLRHISRVRTSTVGGVQTALT